MDAFKLKLHHFISSEFPEHIRAEDPVLVDFLEAYYKFLDVDRGPSNLLLNSNTWSDIDYTLDLFVPLFKKQYAVDVPSSALMQARRIVKHINEYYEAKGSENATKIFFRFMFNQNANVKYPGDYVLRASDGKWSKKRIIKVDASAFSGNNIYTLKNKTIDLNYVEFIPNQGRIIRNVKTSCFNVTRQIEPNIYQLEVSLAKDYVFPDLIAEVDNIDINRDGVTETIDSLGDYDTHVYVVCDGVVYGSISKQITEVQQIIDPGQNFRDDDAYVIGQTGIEGRYFVLSGAAGYVDDVGGPYVFEQFDNNAIIRVSRITDIPERGIDQIRLVNTGQKFLARTVNTFAPVSYFVFPDDLADSYVIDMSNPGQGPDEYATDSRQLIPVNTFTVTIPPRSPRNYTGESAEVTFKTGLVYEQPGTFKDSSGFVSDVNHLQDNYYYQPYSYVIESQQQKSAWETAYLKSNHPAGFKMFAKLQFVDELNVTPLVTSNFDIVSAGFLLELMQGTTVIAQRNVYPTSTLVDGHIVLTPEEIALITDPTDLNMRMTMINDSRVVQIMDISLSLLGS